LRACYIDSLAGPHPHKTVLDVKPDNLGLNKLELTNAYFQDQVSQNTDSRPQTNPSDKQATQDKPKAEHVETKKEHMWKVASENGLHVKFAHGKYEFYRSVNGHEELAFTWDGANADDLDKNISEIVRKREAELTAKYGVRFSHKGEKVSSPEFEGEAVCREPTLKELDGLEQALAKNQYTPDGKTGPTFPKIYFLADNKRPEDAAFYAKDGNGEPSVFVMPQVKNIGAATNKDVPPGQQSIENLFGHELNHWARGWQNNPKAESNEQPLAKEDSDLDPHSPYTQSEIERYKRLGWKQITTETGEKIWAIEGKDHHLYAPVFQSAGGDSLWVRVDEQGTPIDRNGKKLTKPDEQFEDIETYQKELAKRGAILLDERQIIPLMTVKPLSLYFIYPEEELSEGEAYFHSKEKRAVLAGHSWALYQECKQLDQERINQANGVGPNGEPLYIRSPEGRIVPNDEQHRDEVRRFEEAARKKAA
jgi:hypothetical protein